jgi:hypothetical protein
MQMFGPGNKVAVYSFAEDATVGPAIDVHKAIRNKSLEISSDLRVHSNLTGLGDATQLDLTTWLPFAAKEYHISPEFSDYVLVPVFIMPSDLPNRNSVGFPLRELVKFNVAQGRQAYKTFTGKPVHYEHDNKDPHKAHGVIVDTFLKKLAGYGNGKVWKLMELLAIDRTKYPQVSSRILDGSLNTYSMGAFVQGYTCSYCHSPMGQCSHLHPNKAFDFYELNGKLVYRQVHGVEGFETSIVESPAYLTAISDKLIQV